MADRWSAEDFDRIVMYGVCLVCGAPRDAFRDECDGVLTLSMGCTAERDHDQAQASLVLP